MRMSRARRLLAGAMIAVSIPVASVAAFAAPAWANGNVSCTHLLASANTGTGTVTGCTTALVGGSGSLSSFGVAGGDVSWANGTITDYTTTSSTNTGSLCPALSVEYNIIGSVSASTNTHIAVGAVVKMKVCVHQSGTVRNAVGTLVKF